MIVSGQELIDVVVMTVAVGFIFMDIFRFPGKEPRMKPGFDWQALGVACLITAPAIILHELAHKFIAIGFGMNATFHAAYFWLAIGIALKLLHFKFIFFIPGYVQPCSHPLGSTALAACLMQLQNFPLQKAAVAFAGPFLNLVLYVGAWIALKNMKNMSKRTFFVLYLTKQINLLLFVFNMLPFPLFDGFKVYDGLIQAFM